MKNRSWAFIASVAVVFFLVTNGWAAAPITLRWGSYMSDTPTIKIEKKFAQQIMERSNGRVKIELFFSESIGKGDELLTLAGRGGVDMATAAPGFYPNQLLFWRAYQTPFVFDSPRQAINILIKSYEEFAIFREEMDRLNIIWLFHQPNGDFWLNGKVMATNVAMLKGKKIRAYGGDIPRAHAAIGAVPVTVMTQDTYEALQKGIVDYNFFPLPVSVAHKNYEVGKYFSGPISAMSGHIIAIGKPAWNKLPKDIQELFFDQAQKTLDEYQDWLEEYITESIKIIRTNGGVVEEFPPAELDKWKAAAPDLLGMWVKEVETKGRGGEQASSVAKRWRELVKSGYGLKGTTQVKR